MAVTSYQVKKMFKCAAALVTCVIVCLMAMLIRTGTESLQISTSLHQVRRNMGLNSMPIVAQTGNQTMRKALLGTACHWNNKVISRHHGYLPENSSSWKRNQVYRRLLVDDHRRLIYCDIPKAGSSTWKVYLIRTSRLADFGPVTDSHWDGMHKPKLLSKHGLHPLSAYGKDEAEQRLQSYFKFVVVRHPLDRLVSAYYDKMVYHEQYKPSLRKHIIAKYRHPLKHGGELKNESAETDGTSSNYPTFQEFISYLLRENRGRGDHHWSTYERLCNSCHVRYDYIAKTETMEGDFAEMLHHFGPANQSADGWDHLGVVRSLRSNEWNGCRWSRTIEIYRTIPEPQMKQLLAIYKTDFNQFGYKWESDSYRASCLDQVHNNSCC